MMLRLHYLYHLRKPRVVTSVDHAYKAYEKTLTQARRKIHIDEVQYLEQIENAYLDRHQQMIKDKHFEYQCSFRKQIFTDAFRLHQNQLQWAQIDGQYTSALNKHLHEEDVKKINRSRILKIMEHESTHYWLNPENVQQRLQEHTIFPEYIASSEYYYKLFAEALAYELGDFHELHVVSSNEEIIREKNKHLIPLFLTLRSKIKAYKRDEAKEVVQKTKFELNLIQNNAHLSPQESQQLQTKLNQSLEQKLKELEEKKSQQGQTFQLKQKIKDLISIFKTWKQYTNVLVLTSAQIIRNRSDASSEIEIQKSEKEVLKNLSSKMHETFVDSIEEDTEELQISFEEYLAKINQERKDRDVSPTSSTSMEELNTLMGTTEAVQVNAADVLSTSAASDLGLSQLTKTPSQESSEQAVELEGEQLNPLFLSPKQTTSSVQILKEQFGQDKQMLQLLNQLGEIDVRYPKLFQTIWQSSH